jgi:hypothetical protein
MSACHLKYLAWLSETPVYSPPILAHFAPFIPLQVVEVSELLRDLDEIFPETEDLMKGDGREKLEKVLRKIIISILQDNVVCPFHRFC